MDIDQLLREAAPATPTTPELRHDLREMAALAEVHARPRPRRRRAPVLVGALTAAVLGGTAAAASGLVPLPWRETTLPDGRTCRVDYVVEPAGTTMLDAAHPPVGTAAERAAAASAAQEYLSGYDWEAVDTDAAVAAWRETEDRVIAAAAPGEKQPRLEGEELLLHATDQVALADLRAHLEATGHDWGSVDVSTGSRCR